MDTTTIIIVVAVIALIAFWLYNRNKPAPRGTYDDKNVRSSGSIGGGTRAHDDPNVRSSGSIGGGSRAYDTPAHTSGGSIGGRQRTENHHAAEPNSSPRQHANAQEPREAGPGLDEPLPPRNRGIEQNETPDEKRRDDEFRSGGSFGGSRN